MQIKNEFHKKKKYKKLKAGSEDKVAKKLERWKVYYTYRAFIPASLLVFEQTPIITLVNLGSEITDVAAINDEAIHPYHPICWRAVNLEALVVSNTMYINTILCAHNNESIVALCRVLHREDCCQAGAYIKQRPPCEPTRLCLTDRGSVGTGYGIRTIMHPQL